MGKRTKSRFLFGFRVFCYYLCRTSAADLEHVLVQRQVAHELLESTILFIQLLETPRLRRACSSAGQPPLLRRRDPRLPGREVPYQGSSALANRSARRGRLESMTGAGGWSYH